MTATQTILWTIAIATSLPPELAPQAPGTIADSYGRARTLLDQAIAAHGGLDALRAAGRIRVRMEGLDHWRNQSRRVEPPYDTEPWTGDLLLDRAANRFIWTSTSHFPGGFHNASRNVIDGPRGYAANLRQGTHVMIPNRTLDSQRGVWFRLPHLVLLTVLDQAAGLRWLGPVRLSSGGRVEAIATSTPIGAVTLGIDPATKELRALLGVQADPLIGDAATETEFTEYRKVGPVLMPGRRVQRIGGELVQDVRYVETSLDPVFSDSLLQPPVGSVEQAGGPPPASTPVRELAPGVWAVSSGGSWVLAVAFADHLLVVESPGFGLPDAIARIKAAAPGKPIRYVVPTHHHDDHSGGIRYLIAEGATVVTTPGNRAYFTRMAAARASVLPDDATLARPPLKLETITGGKRVFSDGSRTVEIHDIGRGPHVNEMLVAWLPNEGILFQGDLLNLPPSGEVFASSANDTTEHFAQWLARQGWQVRVLAGVHMAPGTKAQLDDAMAKRR